MDVTDFFEFQSPFKQSWEIVVRPKYRKLVASEYVRCNLLHLSVACQSLLNQLRQFFELRQMMRCPASKLR
jgi:hypothetical protein